MTLTHTDPPAEATHWTATMMAKVVGNSLAPVQRIWRAHGSQPHRVQQFKLSNDLKFIDKLRDVVGPLMSIRPPMPSCSRSMKSRKSRPSTAPSPACR